MKRNQSYEPEVDLWKLCFHVICHWRSIVAAAVIGAALLGGFRFLQVKQYKQSDDYAAEMELYQKKTEYYDQSIAEYEGLIDSYKKQLTEREQYRMDSLKMNIDPLDMYVAQNDYFVLMDPEVFAELPEKVNQDPADVVIGIYRSFALAAPEPDKLGELLGEDKAKYLRELVTAEANYDADMLTLSVKADNQERAREILDLFAEYMVNNGKSEADKVGKHELVLAKKEVRASTYSTLMDDKLKLDNSIRDMKASMSKAESELSLLRAGGRPEMPEKGMKKHIAIGFLAGAALMAVIYAVQYLTGGKLRCVDELTEGYSLPAFGVFPQNNKVGNVCRKLAGSFKLEKSELVCHQVASLMEGTFSGECVLLISTLSSRKVQDLYDRLQAQLGSKVKLSLQQNFLGETESLDKASQFDRLMLVEARDDSSLEDIQRLSEMLEIRECNVSGCIIL